ncbi:hypothetical protein B0H19DRAFT_1082873 [Mycena capillaripes]|nr:hypothetical protein B0H19DRAFT_1082873 [Mycena capillaripes]
MPDKIQTQARLENAGHLSNQYSSVNKGNVTHLDVCRLRKAAIGMSQVWPDNKVNCCQGFKSREVPQQAQAPELPVRISPAARETTRENNLAKFQMAAVAETRRADWQGRHDRRQDEVQQRETTLKGDPPRAPGHQEVREDMAGALSRRQLE